MSEPHETTPTKTEEKIFVDMSQGTLQQVSQQVLEAKRMARSLESTADALIPLIESKEELKSMQYVREVGTHAARILNELYGKVARKAHGT